MQIILIVILLLYSSPNSPRKKLYHCSLQLVSSSDSRISIFSVKHTHTLSLKQTHLSRDVKYVNRPNNNLYLITWYI